MESVEIRVVEVTLGVGNSGRAACWRRVISAALFMPLLDNEGTKATVPDIHKARAAGLTLIVNNRGIERRESVVVLQLGLVV